jgi:hypothetical protein
MIELDYSTISEQNNNPMKGTPMVIPQSHGTILLKFDSGSIEVLRPSDIYYLLQELENYRIYP